MALRHQISTQIQQGNHSFSHYKLLLLLFFSLFTTSLKADETGIWIEYKDGTVQKYLFQKDDRAHAVAVIRKALLDNFGGFLSVLSSFSFLIFVFQWTC